MNTCPNYHDPLHPSQVRHPLLGGGPAITTRLLICSCGHFLQSYGTNGTQNNRGLGPRLYRTSSHDFLSRTFSEARIKDRYFGATGRPVCWLESYNPADRLAEYASEVILNPQLLWHLTWTPYSSGLVWDITHPPSVSRALAERLVIVKPDFSAPVMGKEAKCFELWTDHAVLAWYMGIWGPVPVSNGALTVGGLLEAIYAYLGTTLTEQDLHFVRITPQNVALLKKARKKRVKDGFHAVNEVALKGPFRRSDVVGGHRRFQGVRAVELSDGTTRLYFNLGPGPVPRF